MSNRTPSQIREINATIKDIATVVQVLAWTTIIFTAIVWVFA